MNKKIKELLEKEYNNGEPWKLKGEPEHIYYEIREDVLEKFIDSLVKECVSLLPEDCQDTDGVHMSYKITEHFKG